MDWRERTVAWKYMKTLEWHCPQHINAATYTEPSLFERKDQAKKYTC